MIKVSFIASKLSKSVLFTPCKSRVGVDLIFLFFIFYLFDYSAPCNGTMTLSMTDYFSTAQLYNGSGFTYRYFK